jgi:hypothetical protein
MFTGKARDSGDRITPYQHGEVMALVRMGLHSIQDAIAFEPLFQWIRLDDRNFAIG